MIERGRVLDALGGEEGCQRLSAAFYARVAGDLDLRPLFPGKSLRCATEEFAAFLIQFLGGDERMTQDRNWLSLRESHARFQITEAQRTAWLNQMESALRSLQIDEVIQEALLWSFMSASSYVGGGVLKSVEEPELAERWSHARALDKLVAYIQVGQDLEVRQRYREFASRPSIFVGVLARMLQTRRAALVEAALEAIGRDITLGNHRYAGRTLLHYAAGSGCSEVVRLLLRGGVDPNVLDRGGYAPLYRAANECRVETGPEIVRMLVDAGADVNHAGGVTRATPLHMAARRGFVGIAQALLDLGAISNLRDAKGDTPLDRALNCRQSEVAQLLGSLELCSDGAT